MFGEINYRLKLNFLYIKEVKENNLLLIRIGDDLKKLLVMVIKNLYMYSIIVKLLIIRLVFFMFFNFLLNWNGYVECN